MCEKVFIDWGVVICGFIWMINELIFIYIICLGCKFMGEGGFMKFKKIDLLLIFMIL